MMFFASGCLRPVLLSINAFLSKVLSFLRPNRPRKSTPVVDIELGKTSAVLIKPGKNGLDEAHSSATSEPGLSPNYAPAGVPNRCSILIIEPSEINSPTSEHSDSHASTESTKVESTEERSLESAATSVALTLADRTEESKSTTVSDEEILISNQGAPSDYSSQTPDLALPAASDVIESHEMTALEGGTEGVASPVFPMAISYDGNDSDDEDDLGVPTHRCLKLAIDDIWNHNVLHTIKEVDEENAGEEQNTNSCGTSPTIVVQSPSFGYSLSRAQSATNRLAAILKLLESELSESRNSICMDALDSNAKLEVDVRTSSDARSDIGYGWYCKTPDQYHIQPSKMCGGEESWGLLSDDPFKKSL